MTVPKRLHPNHAKALADASISVEVIEGRGYRSLMRTTTDNGPRDLLKRLKFSRAARADERRFPGLLIPLWGPNGAIASHQYRPDLPRKDETGKFRKYEMPQGRSAVLDVHPLNTSRIVDPTIPLWITEGIKKADALTSRDQCVVAISGVFNWRSTHGTLGDWEDVMLRGRTVYVCFDADAATNRNIARAMARLGRWLRSKQAVVRYVVVPPVDGDGKAGADDFLASGGTVAQLLEIATISPPDPDAGDDSLTDSRLAERVADDHLQGRYRYCKPLGGWHAWTGAVWRDCPEEQVTEEVRQYLRDMLAEAASSGTDAIRLGQLAQLQSRARIAAVASLCRGMDGILTAPLDFDEDPWLLCAGNGVVDLRTGELHPHDPDLLMIRQTEVDYIAGATHPDWDKALEALPDDATRAWAQVVLGTGAVGKPATGDEAHFWIGSGANGKTTLLGGCMSALGEYAKVIASALLGGHTPGHPTVKMELFRLRLAVVEELQDGHLLDEARLKEITGTDSISAYRMRQDPVVFAPSHTLVCATNHTPVVTGTDHGIWRRLLAVPFPKRYAGSGQDKTLRMRVRSGRDQRRAILAWLVAGAVAYHRAGMLLPETPEAVRQRTDKWRYEADLMLDFLEAECVFDPAGYVPTGNLLDRFNAYLTDVAKAKPLSARTFANRIDSHELLQREGVRRGRLSGGNRERVAFGVRFRTSTDGARDTSGHFSRFTFHEDDSEVKQAKCPEVSRNQEMPDQGTPAEPPKPMCSRCNSIFGMAPGKTMCANCHRDDYRKRTTIDPEQETA